MTVAHQPSHARLGSAKKRFVAPRVTVSVVLLAILIGHWIYHYRPRVRGLPGGSGSALEQLSRSPEARLALWLAYPHQNLGALENRVGDLDGYLADLGTVIGGETIRLPGFGPFRFPPASELVVVRATSDPQWRGAAEIYPLVAAAARGAGLLTGNRWLAGGAVGEGAERVLVAWHGRRWQLGSLPPGPASRTSSRDSPGAVVGRLRAVEDLGRWPAGDYDLIVRDQALYLGPHGVPVTDLESSLKPWSQGGMPQRVPLAAREVSPDGERALLLFADARGGLPGAASIARGTGRWRLPGERLLTRLGAELFEGAQGNWTLVAFSPADLERARKLLPKFADADAPLGWSAAVAAGPVSRLSEGIGKVLAEVPVVGERESRSWMALSRLLAPLGEEGLIEVSLGDPAFVRVDLGADR